MESKKDLWEEIKDDPYTYGFDWLKENNCETVKRITNNNNLYVQLWYYVSDDVICYSVYNEYGDIKDSGVIYTMEDFETVLEM